MTGLRRGVGLAVGVLALWMAGPAGAQENLDLGKSPAQLFSSDCGICHKTTAGLSKGSGGPFGGLQSFLREHYTASREAASAIAAYVEATDKGPPADKHKAGNKRTAKGDEKAKKVDSKKDETKKENVKKDESKKDAGKSADTKAGDKPSDESKKSDDKKPDAGKIKDKSKEKADEKSSDKPASKPDKPKSTKTQAKASDTKASDKPDDQQKKTD